jgi:hypothetical protein
MPNLGLYLLYRIAPLVTWSTIRPIIVWMGALSALPVLARLILHSTARTQTTAATAVTAMLGSLALIAAASGHTSPVVWFLLWGTPLRLALWALLPAPTRSKRMEHAPRADDWSQQVARVIHDGVEVNLLERGLGALAQGVVGIARFFHRTVEQDGLEALLRLAIQGAWGFSRWLQRHHTGQLRRNLTWITLALALGIVALVVRGW